MKGKKTGGRQPGSINKTTKAVKECITSLLTEYTNSEQMMKDFAELEPRDRLIISEKFMAYVAPKLQSTAVDLTASGHKTIEDKLIDLSQGVEESTE